MEGFHGVLFTLSQGVDPIAPSPGPLVGLRLHSRRSNDPSPEEEKAKHQRTTRYPSRPAARDQCHCFPEFLSRQVHIRHDTPQIRHATLLRKSDMRLRRSDMRHGDMDCAWRRRGAVTWTAQIRRPLVTMSAVHSLPITACTSRVCWTNTGNVRTTGFVHRSVTQ